MSVKTALLTLTLVLAAWAQEAKKDPEEEKKKEEEAKAKLAEFRKELKTCKMDKDVERALEGLGALQHPRVLAELKGWLGKGSADVAVAAAEQIGKYKKDKDAAEALTGAAGARKEKDAIVKFLRYAGDVGCKPTTLKLLAYFRNKDLDVAKEAIDSCAKLKSRDAMEPLISMARELEGVKEEKDTGGLGGGGILGGGGVTGGVNEPLARKKALLSPAITALEQISGQKFSTSKEADQWWRANRSTFKESE